MNGSCCKAHTPEQRQGVHKLPQHGGQPRLGAEHRRLYVQALRGPEAAGLPVGEGPLDAQLVDQGKNVVVLQAATQAQTSRQAM